MAEPLEGVWHAGIVGIEREEQLTLRLADACIERNVLSAVRLREIPDWVGGLLLPLRHQVRSLVAGTVIHYQPLEVPARLSGETRVHALERVRAIVRRCEYRE